MNRPAKYACNYAVLRFLPYPETGEFVNLGVVVHCALRGLFEMKIESRKAARVTDFFSDFPCEKPFFKPETHFVCAIIWIHRIPLRQN